MKIIKIRHVSVLKLADPEALLIEDMPDINPKSQEKVWEVINIINLGLINNNKRKYFIKWKEYPYSDNIWEPIENLYYPKKLRKFH